MNFRLQLLLCSLLAVAVAAAEGPQHRMASAQAAKNGTGGGPEKKKIEVCKLLTSAEIQGVQGEPVEAATPGTQPGGGLLMSQCLFRTATPAKSVSLALAVPAKQRPRDFWRKQFHAAAAEPESGKSLVDSEKERARGPEDEEGAKPRMIANVGDEAYWVGGPITGALYALRGKTFIRVSVGGVREESVRIEKSVALARAALKRL
jgi:hypothetical protein